MSGPPMAVEFLYQVQTIKRIKEGKIAIIHLDSTDSILYDVMRYWRLELSKRSNLGDAGQSLLLLGALPYGNGYDYQSVNLNSVCRLFYLLVTRSNNFRVNKVGT